MLRSSSGLKVRQRVRALPVDRADDQCRVRQQPAHERRELPQFGVPALGADIRFVEKLGEDPVGRKSSDHPRKRTPCRLERGHRLCRLVAMECVELRAGMQVDHHRVSELGDLPATRFTSCSRLSIALAAAELRHDRFRRDRQADVAHALAVQPAQQLRTHQRRRRRCPAVLPG